MQSFSAALCIGVYAADILASVPVCLWPVEGFSQEEGTSTSFLPVMQSIQAQTCGSSPQSQWFIGRGRNRRM